MLIKKLILFTFLTFLIQPIVVHAQSSIDTQQTLLSNNNDGIKMEGAYLSIPTTLL